MNYCSNCGAVLNIVEWPKPCAACNAIHYGNPDPVAIALIRVMTAGGEEGVLIGRRPESHFMTPWALIGGFAEKTDPSIEFAAAREVWEETGIKLEPSSLEMTSSAMTPGNQMLIFCKTRDVHTELDIMSQFAPTDEILEIMVTREAINLAFPLHTRALSDFFISKGC